MTIAQNPRSVMRAASWGALIAAIALLVSAVTVRMTSAVETRSASIQWFDVLIVQIASSLPLAWWISVWSGSWRRFARTLVASMLFVTVTVLFFAAVSLETRSAIGESVFITVFVLTTTSLCTIVTVGLVHEPAAVPASLMTAGVMTVMAFAVPATYLQARLRYEQQLLGERLDQSRFGETLVIARPIVRIDPGAVVHGRPVTDVVATLKGGVEALRRQADAPLPEKMTDDLRLTLARGLAILARTDEAIEMLRPCNESNPDRWLLEGTIRENLGEWDAGAAAYQQAATILESAKSPPRTKRIMAIRGIGFCERKAGRARDAEAAYQQLVTLAPTADSHFLAAQFYEDAQSTAEALRHAQQAMALDPARYGEPGRKLVDRLQTLHFGCWGVYRDAR